MSAQFRKYKNPIHVWFGGIFLLILLPWSITSGVWRIAGGQDQPDTLALLLGSTDSATYTDFLDTAAARSRQNLIEILLLPIGISPDSHFITANQRQAILLEVEGQAQQISSICKVRILLPKTCKLAIAPILVRSDAEPQSSRDYFANTPSAILILENELSTASEVIRSTPVEEELTRVYLEGALIAGGKSLSRYQIQGYNPGFSLETSLDFGAANIEGESDRAVIRYQIQDAVLETSLFQSNETGLLINALALSDYPHVGIGMHSGSTVQLASSRLLQNPTGPGIIPILDAETYHAADAVQYHGAANTLSLRNLLFHVLSPGGYTYDIAARQHSLSPPAARLERDYMGMRTPARAGLLVLSGAIDYDLPQNPVLFQFLNHIGGQTARLMVLVGGYPSQETAQQVAKEFIDYLGVAAEVHYFSSQIEPQINIPDEVSGIVILARYPSLLAGTNLSSVIAAWRNGLPVMAVDAAAAMAGSYMVTQELPSPSQVRMDNRPFYFGTTLVEPGLHLVDMTVEPQVNEENRWGRWIHLAYHHPENLAIGLSRNTALFLSPNGAFTVGEHAIAILDLRFATLGLGKTGAFSFANGLVDIFAPGDVVYPQIADMRSAPLPVATPMLPSPTPVSPNESPPVTITPSPILSPTPTEEEFSIPFPDLPLQPDILIRPPPNQVLTTLMIALPVSIVLIILIGLWMNRRILK